MFTGLIEALGEIREIKSQAGGVRLGLMTDLTSSLSPGDSLAVNGVCLTIAAADGDVSYMDVSPETMRVTTIGGLARGATVNLERPLRADARVGGHFVQGHVDGTGSIDEIRREAESYWLTIRFPASLAPCIVRKGSIAVDGISLTVAGVRRRPVRRADHPVHVGTHESARGAGRRPGQPRVRHSGKVRRARARNAQSRVRPRQGNGHTCEEAGTQGPKIPVRADRRRHRRHSPRRDDHRRRRRGPRERRRPHHRGREDHARRHQLHGQARPRPDLHADDRGSARRARPAADGSAEHRAVRHRLLRVDRSERRHQHRHLGGRSRGDRAHGDRSVDAAVDLARPGHMFPLQGAQRRRAGARGPDRGGRRSRAHRRAVSRRRHLRNHER